MSDVMGFSDFVKAERKPKRLVRFKLYLHPRGVQVRRLIDRARPCDRVYYDMQGNVAYRWRYLITSRDVVRAEDGGYMR